MAPLYAWYILSIRENKHTALAEKYQAGDQRFLNGRKKLSQRKYTVAVTLYKEICERPTWSLLHAQTSPPAHRIIGHHLQG